MTRLFDSDHLGRVCICSPVAGGRGRIEIVARSDVSPGVVSIAITDNSGGIPADLIDRIFEPFYTTKQVGSGTGLGLSVSHRIIEAMSGRLAASNTETGAGLEWSR